MEILETERLRIRWLNRDDAPFILKLLNDPDWLRYIGDRGVRNLDDARAYIEEGPVAMYHEHGCGLYAVDLKEPAETIGLCGVLRRDMLDDPDLGFAFLPGHRGRGYAHESSVAVMCHARSVLGMQRIVAVVSPGNDASMKLLEKLGFRFERMVRLGRKGAPAFCYGVMADSNATWRAWRQVRVSTNNRRNFTRRRRDAELE